MFDLKPKNCNKSGNIPIPSSSDVGDVSWVCPVSQCGIGAWSVGTAAHGCQAVACGKSDFVHRGMLYAGQIITATAVDVCNNPEIIETAWKKLKEKTGNHPYHCPISPEITPEIPVSETT